MHGAWIVIRVPGLPQGKGRPRVGRVAGHARMFTPAKTVAYEGLIAHEGASVMGSRAPLEGPVRIEVTIMMPVPASWSRKKTASALAGDVMPTGKPDYDNVLKAIGDGLNGIVWRDDSQIVKVGCIKLYSETPGLRVMVMEYSK